MNECKHCKKEIGYFSRGRFDFCSDNCILEYIKTLESKVIELSRLAEHGNGPVLLGWVDAHKKAMDRVVELEPKLNEALSLIDGVTEVVELHKCHSPSQSSWKEHWLRRANSILRNENK